ncbi:MAG: folate-binding protein YgfZ [Gammaproteobacteria bacterium]|nr:folate-binding protein YgfZ [Gammaproteobacteria bacterium]
MCPDWQAFLITQGGIVEDGVLLGFSEYDNKTFDNFITDLSHLALIDVSGEDANDFLNGQFTTNIKQLAKDHLQFSAWCNPKGQVKTTFYIYRNETGFNILLPVDLRDSFIKQLQMYIMRANVKLIDKSNKLVRVGIQTNNNKLLAELMGPRPEQNSGITIQNDLHCLHAFGSENISQRYIFIGSVERNKILWKDFSKNSCPVGAALWELLDIQAAYPWLSSQTTEKFLPQMLNLDLIDGLNYQKGCFPGQEIIARLHFRGQLKRSLYLATCSLDAQPEITDQLYISDHKNSVGIVINVQAFEDKYYLLAVIEKALIEHNLALRAPNGASLTLQPLPYKDA